MKLSKNFSLNELTRSGTADRLGIDNTPDDLVIVNLQNLCDTLLQPIRDHFGKVFVTSGYRSPELNRRIGGSKTSQHCYGQAADCKFESATLVEVARWIINQNLPFDQMIIENYHADDPDRGWLHLSVTTGANRKQILTATFKNGRAVYHAGFPK